MSKVDIECGVSFVEACHLLLATAKENRCWMSFNDHVYHADETTTLDMLKAEFNRINAARAKARRKTGRKFNFSYLAKSSRSNRGVVWLSDESLSELKRLSELTGLPLSTLVNYSVTLLNRDEGITKLKEAYAAVLRVKRNYDIKSNGVS